MKLYRPILTVVIFFACPMIFMGASRITIEDINSISDTWANPDYDEIENTYAKIKFKDSNHWSTYDTTSSSKASNKGKYIIVEGWHGDEYKNTYYDDTLCYKVVRTTEDGTKYYELFRFNNLYGHEHFGKVLEIASSTEDFPIRINSYDNSYSILYLQQGRRIVRSTLAVTLLLLLIGGLANL